MRLHPFLSLLYQGIADLYLLLLVLWISDPFLRRQSWPNRREVDRSKIATEERCNELARTSFQPPLGIAYMRWRFGDQKLDVGRRELGQRVDECLKDPKGYLPIVLYPLVLMI
jgi:hypothetical protein